MHASALDLRGRISRDGITAAFLAVVAWAAVVVFSEPWGRAVGDRRRTRAATTRRRSRTRTSTRTGPTRSPTSTRRRSSSSSRR